jgi:hypothetical protein
MNILQNGVTVNWEDATASVKCPCCHNDLYLDTQNGWTKCTCCGHIYTASLLFYEIVDDPKPENDSDDINDYAFNLDTEEGSR